uniref:ShKT domain-containing protein n=2 Tax=Meloidogyne incognita group TaxID=654580 RepID=A0A914N923_MELIC
MFYAEKQILDKDKLKNNNSSLKSPKNLQKIEIFGPPIRGPIPRPSAPEDAFILNQSAQQQDINEAKENIFDNNNSKPPKVLPWWTWKKMAVQNENGKKSIVEDLTNQCCQWALDGLCDRSWQRIRELCPKSCGTVLCSSFEGTLSCSRVLDVDVIGCYEHQKQNYFISTNSNLGQFTSTKFTKGKDEIINERKVVYENDNFVEFKQKKFEI